MAEYIQEIALEPANQAINNSGDFYKPTRYEWFGSHGTERYTHPNTFRPDFGHGGSWDQDWVQNVSAGSIPDFYVTRTKAPWKIPASISNADHGFYIEKPSTTEAKQINIRIDGGVGHWMPAAIYRNIGWYWKNATAANANWRVWSPGLVLRNWKTNEEKIYSIGWTEAAYVSTAGQIKVVTGQQKSDPVNALGPDWFIYGAIFQMRSDGTSGNQSPKAELLDLVLSWHNLDAGPGATKLIIPDKMSWDDFRALKQRGEVSYYEKPQVTNKQIVGEWDWNGKSSNYLLYYMCKGTEYVGTAFYFTSSDHTRVARYDKYGRDLLNTVKYTDLWFKLDGYPAVFRPAETFSVSNTTCSMPLVSTTGPDLSNGKEDQGGVLRAYLQNPDA